MNKGKRFRLLSIISLLLLSCWATSAMAQEYTYISPQELKVRLDRGDIEQGHLILFSTQTAKEYATGFLPTAIPTFARPLESETDYRKLDPVLAHAKGTKQDIVIICPRGGSGAKRSFDYFKEKGIDPSRLLLLEGGQEHYNKAYPQDVVKASR